MKKVVSYKLKGQLMRDDVTDELYLHEITKDGEVEHNLTELLEMLMNEEIAVTIKHVEVDG